MMKDRKTISLKKEFVRELNQYRRGGESWQQFFENLMPAIRKIRGAEVE